MAPTMWNSGRGTAINVGGLQGPQLQRVQTLANAGYGTRAQTVANTLNTRIPKAPVAPVSDAANVNTVAANALANPTGGTGPISNNADSYNAAVNAPATPPTGGTSGGVLTGTAPTSNVNSNLQPGNQPQQKPTPWQVPTDLATLNAQRTHIAAGIAARKAAGQASPQDTARLAQIDKAIAGLPAASTTPAPTTTTNTGTTGTTPDPNANGNILFPGNFEKDYTGDPLYNWQLQQGLDQADKSLAARGLYNSGAGIKQELNVQGQTAANATDREQQLATDNANRAQAYQFNAGARQDNQTQNQWNNVLTLAQLMSNQSPYQSGLQGLTQTGQLTKEQANAFAQYLASQGRGSGGGGGGHRGGGAPNQIPLPSGPDYSGITPLQINGGAANNNALDSILNTAYTSFFPPQTNVGTQPGSFKIVPA